MHFAPAYIVQRFFFRLFDFFHHWYVHGIRLLTHRFMEFISGLDQTIALKVTIRHFAQPLYKDYTVVGRVLGVIFRSGRILIGGVVYLAIAVVFLAVCAAWAFTPPLIMLYALREAVGA